MTISIIIPTFNEYENLLQLQKFFLTLPLTNTEIIIADSKYSEDATSSLRSPFKYIQTNKSGRAAQMNEGAKYAIGEILVFLHADVVPPPTLCAEMRCTIADGFLFGFFAYRFHPTSLMLNINASFTGRKSIFAGGGDQIHFMHRSLYEKLNGYDEKYHIMEDFDFMRKVKKARIPYKIIQSRAVVSSRKYNNNSWIKVNLVNLIAFVMFYLNINSKKIKHFYYSRLR